jgi:hypothetical protein
MKKATILAFVILSFSSVTAQTCGFGCLGLSGFYAGYSAQFYDMSTLNKLMRNKMEEFGFENTDINFETGYGARFGANIFRAKFDNYFLTAKGYYQFLKEERSVNEEINSFSSSYNSKLELDHWGVGVDFGVPLFDMLDWKIVEGGITFYTSKLENTFRINDDIIDHEIYEEEKINVGFYVGTGLVIHLIRDYISIEGTAVYNQLQLGNLVDNDGNYLLDPASSISIMDRGGVTATIQLNIGVPL